MSVVVFCVILICYFSLILCYYEWERCADKSRVGGFDYSSDELDCIT